MRTKAFFTAMPVALGLFVVLYISFGLAEASTKTSNRAVELIIERG